MLNDDRHLSDRELLLIADGELPLRRAARSDLHLAECQVCGTRLREIEERIADFTQLHHENIDPHLASAADSRALLKTRLTELAASSRASRWPLFLRSAFAGRIAACVFAVLLIAAMGILATQHHRLRYEFEPEFGDLAHSPVPNRSLTPGATRSVTIADVCTAQHAQTAHAIPISVQREIFQEYGIPNAQPRDYELDYLITPELGGSDDRRNLWPEPHSDTVWNSYVKDDLEDRLHQLVCDGSLDLATAQHDIATDWIAAYKKYFHTDRPFQIHLDPTPSPYRGPNG